MDRRHVRLEIAAGKQQTANAMESSPNIARSAAITCCSQGSPSPALLLCRAKYLIEFEIRSRAGQENAV